MMLCSWSCVKQGIHKDKILQLNPQITFSLHETSVKLYNVLFIYLLAEGLQKESFLFRMLLLLIYVVQLREFTESQ